jgi:hypothetical protein
LSFLVEHWLNRQSSLAVFVLWLGAALINAFHPDYVKTYMPEFVSKMRLESFQYANGVINGGKSKASRESAKGKTVNTINAFPKTQKRVSTERTDFYVYSKAGMPKP